MLIVQCFSDGAGFEKKNDYISYTHTHTHRVNKREREFDYIFARLRGTIIHIKCRNCYIFWSLYTYICISTVI